MHVELEARSSNAGLSAGFLSPATWRDRNLLACAQAGLVNNLNDAVAWGLLPVLLRVRA